MDAIKYLIGQHNRFKKIFNSLSKKNVITRLISSSPSYSVRKRKFEKLCRELVVHEKSEQTVWYPALRKKLAIKNILNHLLKEEKSAAKAIKSFKSVKSQSVWEIKFEKFKHDVIHHADDEQEKLFPIVRKNMDSATLEKLGKKLKAFKASHLATVPKKKKKAKTRKK